MFLDYIIQTMKRQQMPQDMFLADLQLDYPQDMILLQSQYMVN